MKFFLDNNLPPTLAEALHALAKSDHEIVHLRQKYPQSMSDKDWIEALSAEKGWIVISGDCRITTNPHNRRAWLQSGLTAFFLKKGWTNHVFWDQSWMLIRWFPVISKQAESAKPGQGFYVPLRFGRLEEVHRDQ